MIVRTAIVEESGYSIEVKAHYLKTRHYSSYSVYRASIENSSYLPACCDMLKQDLKSANIFKLAIWPRKYGDKAN